MTEILLILVKCQRVVQSCTTLDQLDVAEKFVKACFRELNITYPEAWAYLGSGCMTQYSDAARGIVKMLKAKRKAVAKCLKT
ncbi:MAG: hypothetical protein WAW37_00090 [Syntrophobacteraceae bacterium]